MILNLRRVIENKFSHNEMFATKTVQFYVRKMRKTLKKNVIYRDQTVRFIKLLQMVNNSGFWVMPCYRAPAGSSQSVNMGRVTNAEAIYLQVGATPVQH